MSRGLAAKVLLKAKALLKPLIGEQMRRVKKPDPLTAEEADKGFRNKIWSDGGGDSSLEPAYYSGEHGFTAGGELMHEPSSGGKVHAGVE